MKVLSIIYALVCIAVLGVQSLASPAPAAAPAPEPHHKHFLKRGYYAAPVAYAPVYVQPQPVYIQPAPVVVAPQPVLVQPVVHAPAPPPYYHHEKSFTFSKTSHFGGWK